MVVLKNIPEISAPATLTVVADGALTVGKPVLVYKDTAGYKAKITALANSTNLVGKIPGISLSAVSSGKVGQVCIAGKAAVTVSAGTVGQVVTAIASGGTCTTQTYASAAAANIYGVYTATKEVTLVG